MEHIAIPVIQKIGFSVKYSKLKNIDNNPRRYRCGFLEKTIIAFCWFIKILKEAIIWSKHFDQCFFFLAKSSPPRKKKSSKKTKMVLNSNPTKTMYEIKEKFWNEKLIGD